MDLLGCDNVMECSPPGSAGVPPAQHRQGLAQLLHPARPATAPGLRFGRAMRFTQAAWPVAPSRGNRASPNVGACGRDARAPGWAPLPIALAPRGSTRRLAGPQTVSMRQSRPSSWPFVVLRVTSWITLFSFVSGQRSKFISCLPVPEPLGRKLFTPHSPPAAVDLPPALI